MKNETLRRRLPPPPLFTIRPPPKPPGSFFEKFQTVEILNGQCVRPSLHTSNSSLSSSSFSDQPHESINWFNFILLLMAILSVICCIVIAIFIYICLQKLKKEEKQYKNYLMSGSLSSRQPRLDHFNTFARTSEHYKCASTAFHCCDDYHSHQLMSLVEPPNPSTSLNREIILDDQAMPVPSSNEIPHQPDDGSPNHQYECIPEYLLTMTRHHHSPVIYHKFCQQLDKTCSVPYTTISRSYLQPREMTTANNDHSQCTCPCSSITSGPIIAAEESSTPLLCSSLPKESQKIKNPSSPKSMMMEWSKRSSLSSSKRKPSNNEGNQTKMRFFSHLKKTNFLK